MVLNARLWVAKAGTGEGAVCEGAVCAGGQAAGLAGPAGSREGTDGPGMQHQQVVESLCSCSAFGDLDFVICEGIPALAGGLIKKKQL